MPESNCSIEACDSPDHGMSRLHPDVRDRLRARYARNLIAFEYGIAS